MDDSRFTGNIECDLHTLLAYKSATSLLTEQERLPGFEKLLDEFLEIHRTHGAIDTPCPTHARFPLLQHAVEPPNEFVATTKALLDHGADPNVVSRSFESDADRNLHYVRDVTPLCRAVMRGHARIAGLLRDAGARLDFRHTGYDMVQLACLEEQPQMLEQLRPSPQDLRGCVLQRPALVPLVIAGRRGHVGMCQWLIDHGVSPLEKAGQRSTALELIVKGSSRAERVRALPVLLEAAARDGADARVFLKLGQSTQAVKLGAQMLDLMRSHAARAQAQRALAAVDAGLSP